MTVETAHLSIVPKMENVSFSRLMPFMEGSLKSYYEVSILSTEKDQPFLFRVLINKVP